METSCLTDSLFGSIPGKLLSVAEVIPTLTRIWQTEQSATPDSHCRASQLNLIVHFGTKTLPDQASGHIHTALAFAQRYPCRIVVLCPEEATTPCQVLRAKLFSQCFMQPGSRNTVCCDLLSLSYCPTRDSAYLSDQVSVWLDNDLPTYHWFCGLSAQELTARYQDFLTYARRIVIDTAGIQDPKVYTHLPWPKGSVVQDLAYARTLALRQALGQHLSQHAPAVLVDGLQRVHACTHPSYLAEARALIGWVRLCLAGCKDSTDAFAAPATGPTPDAPSPGVHSANPTLQPHLQPSFLPEGIVFDISSDSATKGLSLSFQYARSPHFIQSTYDPATGQGTLDLNLGHPMHASLSLVPPSEPTALAQAIFF